MPELPGAVHTVPRNEARSPLQLTFVLLPLLLIGLVTGPPASGQSDSDLDRPLSEQLREAFAAPLQEKSGRLAGTAHRSILLEAGSLLHTEKVIASRGESGATALNHYDFVAAYGDLRRSQLDASGSASRMPSVTEVFELSHSIRQQRRAIPISLAVVDYSSYGERASKIRFDKKGRAQLPRRGPDHRRFVAAGAMADVLPSWNTRIIVPSQLMLGNVDLEGATLAVRANRGEWQPVEVDRVHRLDPTAFGRTPADRDSVELEFRIAMPDRSSPVFATSAIQWHASSARPADRGKRAAIDVSVRPTAQAPSDPDCPVTCYDMPQVTAEFPFPEASNIRGKLNPRIYPSKGHVELINGRRVPKLQDVIVIVDGFDAFNNRTHDNIWSDFERGLLEFLEWGFDLVVIDYDNGHDYLQRNGYAMREMFKVAQGWRDDAHADDPLIAVCGSMGTQTCRWGLRTAELGYPRGEPEDHGVGLFIAVDGPFHGANIPIGLQAIADFLKDEAAEGELFQIALNSPAARTLMPRTRLVGVDLPKKNSPRPAPGWYVADPRHREHYDLVNQDWFGLPRTSRNVALASGSGTGTLQVEPPQPGWLPTSFFNRVFKDNILGRVNIWAQTDHDGGHIFHGHLRKFLSWRTRDLYLGPQADWIDVAPGDLRFTPLQLAQAWNGGDDPFGTMEVFLPFHNFSTTSSVLYTRDKSPYYFPAQDPSVEDNIPFDAFQWEKCNLAHVAITNAQLAFVRKEINSFRRGRIPKHKAQYSEPCGTPEPVDRCLGYVDWFENPSKPTNRRAWYDGANCFVKGVPRGETGFVADNKYWVERQGGICRVGIPSTVDNRPACYLGEPSPEYTAFEWHGAFYYDGYD